MGVRLITNDKGHELVVLSRRDYDVLLASLGDEGAEDRMTAVIAEHALARIRSGEEVLIPSDIVFGMIDGASRVRAVREHCRRGLDELAMAAGFASDDLRILDDGTREPTDNERRRLAAALDVDPRWLEPL